MGLLAGGYCCSLADTPNFRQVITSEARKEKVSLGAGKEKTRSERVIFWENKSHFP